jgi:hypothetical protein
MRNLFFSLIYSHLTYAITVWGSAYSTAQTRLTGLYNRAIRLLPALPHSDAGQVAKLNNVLTYEYVYKYFMLVKMWRVLHDGQHQYFSDRVATFQIGHAHPTRFKTRGDLTLPSYTKTKCQNSFLYRGLSYWNELPGCLRDVDQHCKFNKLLKTHLVDIM